MDDEVDARIARLFGDDPDFGTLDRALVRRMMTRPPGDDGPFFMCNYVRLREKAEYPDGRETTLTGAEANTLYGQMVLPILADIGARPVFATPVEATIQTSDVEWDEVAVVRYPSRAAFFEMLEREDFRAAAPHKLAGVEQTLVMPAHRIGEDMAGALPPVDLGAVPYPPSEQDMPVAIVHLYDYRPTAVYEDGRDSDLTGQEAVALYGQGRVEQGVIELGVRPAFWLEIEGMLYGGEPVFDEFRVNLFPSQATFLQVASMSEDAGIVHRQAGLAHLYTLMTRPLINEYGYP